MNPIRKIPVFVLFLCFLFPALAAAESPSGGGGKAWIIPIRGDIEPSLATFVRREARKALSGGAEYLIFEIDTFGGRVDSALQITSFIMSVNNTKTAKTVAWINNGEDSMGVSWSAGALIAFSCAEIYMASGTSIGAAAPVTPGAGGTMEGAGEKTVAAVRSQMAALAEGNGHPVDIALAMVDYDEELWEATVDGKIRVLSKDELDNMKKDVRDGKPKIEHEKSICPKGKLLSLRADDAVRYGLAAGRADSQEALLDALGVKGGAVVEASPDFADSVISFLTSGIVQTVLIILGVVLIFIELQTPGFGMLGMSGIIAFLIVFGSSFMLGRVGSLEIILFLAGLGLLAVEIFVLPGFGVTGVVGFILIGLSLILSMQDFVIPRFDWEWAILGRNALVVFLSLLAAVTVIAIIALLGPRTRLFDRLTLKAAITGTAGGPDPDSAVGKAIGATTASDSEAAISGVAAEDEESFASLVGKTGVSDSILRPSGRAVFDGKIYDVVADGAFIEPGIGITVTRVRGNRIIVRRV